MSDNSTPKHVAFSLYLLTQLFTDGNEINVSVDSIVSETDKITNALIIDGDLHLYLNDADPSTPMTPITATRKQT